MTISVLKVGVRVEQYLVGLDVIGGRGRAVMRAFPTDPGFPPGM
jgi:hypothetical protein